jgi:hypothetical protein
MRAGRVVALALGLAALSNARVIQSANIKPD